MQEILKNLFEKLLNQKKGFKIVGWIIIIAIILAIVFYPIIDANFLYYNRTNKRIEIIQKIVSIDENSIKKDKRIEEEYNNILNDMNNQSENYINNIFKKETSTRKNVAKFISGAWLFVFVGIILPFSIDKNTGRRLSKNNILGSIVCLVIACFLGWICVKIPNIFSFIVNIVLYQIILIFLAYTIATSGKNS